jgi:hypothetical protein
MARMSPALPSVAMAWKLWKSAPRSTSAKCRNSDRPASVARSSQRACQPPQLSETRALGARCWWKIAWIAR